MARETAAATLDSESRALLYEGANLSQLGLLFKCDHRVLVERLHVHNVKPIGKRGKGEIYDISEVARSMGRLTEEQVDAAMRRMNHADLPKTLTKEYWAGLRSRQDYLLKDGDLWPTNDVITAVAEMVKTLKMELDLLTDAIERQTEMSERQREIATGLIDGAKLNMQTKLREQFLSRAADSDRPEIQQPVEDSTAEDDDDEL